MADRWHIGKNLAESVSTLLARCRAEIRHGLQVQTISEQEREDTEPVLQEERCPPRSRSDEQARVARRAQKLDRYTQVIELHDQGLTALEIASRIGISGRTGKLWLRNGSFPEARRRRRRPSLIDPYERYILSRWQEGCASRLTVLPRTDSSRIQRVTQSYVPVSGEAADPSTTLIGVGPIETAKVQECPFVTCTPGKLLCTARHLAVFAPTD